MRQEVETCCSVMHLSAAILGGWTRWHTGEWRGICWLLSPIFGPGRGHWTTFALPRQDTRGKSCGICNIAAILTEVSVFSLKLSFHDLQCIKLNLAVCRKQVDWLFLLTVYFIVKLLLNIMLEITLQFQIMLPGGGTVVAFCGRILALGGWNLQMSWCRCPGIPRVNPPGWPLISA